MVKIIHFIEMNDDLVDIFENVKEIEIVLGELLKTNKGLYKLLIDEIWMSVIYNCIVSMSVKLENIVNKYSNN